MQIGNSSTSMFGEWKSINSVIILYLNENGTLSARIKDKAGIHNISQVKCGINGTISHANFIQRINSYTQEKLQENIAVFPCPSQGQAEEIWVFEATKMTAPWIRKAKETLKKADEDQKEAIECCQKALKNFQTALKIQESTQGETTDLKTAILQIKKKLFLLTVKYEASLYLACPKEIEELNEVINIYGEEENIFPCLFDYVKAFQELSPFQQLITAMVHENTNNPIDAVPHYLDLAEKHPNPLPCIKKAELLIRRASDSFAFPHFLEKLNRDWLIELSCKVKDPDLERWILQKDAIRMVFEEYLHLMSKYSTQNRAPTCFICFNVEETDVGKWLEQVLVPDLDKIGIKPLFCFRDLGPGKELNSFQGLIRDADQVIIVCTPDLKKKCDARKKAPTGVAQEIRLAQERYNDPEKYQTIFPLYLKGERKSSCPSVFFEPILGTKFTFLDKSNEASVFSYYPSIFELLGVMRGIPRERSRQIKQDFLDRIKKILNEGEIDQFDLETWRKQKPLRIEQIVKSIQERVSKNIQMINLPLPPKDFTGREKEIKKLHEACKREYRVALTGLGGVGKTALVLKYADEYKSHYQFICFMPAATSQLLIKGLITLADDLHVPKSDKFEERLYWLKTTLDRFEKEYLVIFDGVDEAETFDKIEKYLPEKGRCLLLTSRLPEQSNIHNFERIKLNPFTIEEAVDYLLKATGSDEKEQISALAEKVSGLPLALTHAVGYIRSRGIGIKEYVLDFNKYELELFKNEYLTLKKNERTILTTWKMSIDAIEKKLDGPLGKEILELFAFLGQTPIPLGLINNWFRIAHPNVSDLKFKNALRYLLDYSMIDNPHPNVYEVHSLVQTVVRFQMPNEKQQEVYLQAFEMIIVQMNLFKEEDITTWDQSKLCIPHAMVLLETESLMKAVALKDQCLLMNSLTRIFGVFGDFYGALKVGENCLKIAKIALNASNLKEDKLAISTSLSNIGALCDSLGEYKKALEYNQKALEIHRELFDENHLDIATIYNNIGELYRNQEEFEKALGFHKKALNILKALKGHQSDIARSYNNIGLIYHDINNQKHDINNQKQALKYYEKALKIRMQVLGENHPDLATSYNNIAEVYATMKDFKKALEYHEIALKIRIQVLGENHPDVATSYNNLGAVYNNLANFEEALEKLQKALKIRIKVFNENHPNVAKIYSNMGMVYQGFGDYRMALHFHEQALKIWLQVFGKMDLNVIMSYNNVSLVYQSLGDFDKALDYCQKALEIRLQLFGENHLDVAKSYNNIGEVYHSLGHFQKALGYHQKALEIRLQLLGENNPDLARSYNNIGEVYYSLGDFKKTLEYQEKTLKIQLQAFGENNQSVATSYNNIAGVYHSLGNFEKALEIYQKALMIWLKVLGEKHPHVAMSYNNIGTVYASLGNFEKAIEHCQKALKIQLQVFGENHPDVAKSYSNIGCIYNNLENFEQALKYFEMAFIIFCNAYKQSNPQIANLLQELLTVAKKLKSSQLKGLEHTYELSVRIFGLKHEFTKELHRLILVQSNGSKQTHYLGSFVCNILGDRAYLYLQEGSLRAEIYGKKREIIHLSTSQIKGGREGNMSPDQLIQLIQTIAVPLLFASYQRGTLQIFARDFQEIQKNQFLKPRITFPSRYFTSVKREKILSKLQKILQEKQIVLLLNDPAIPLKRVGKTEIVTHYFEEHKKDYTHAFWIQASDPWYFKQDIEKMAHCPSDPDRKNL